MTTEPDMERLESAFQLLQSNKKPDALTEFLRLDQLGSANAAYYIGIIHVQNNNVREAEAFFRKAAARNHVTAQYNLGVVLFEQGNVAAAYDCFKKAADQGSRGAKFRVYTTSKKLDFAPLSEFEALRFLQESAQLGDPMAKQSLLKAEVNGKLGIFRQVRAIALFPVLMILNGIKLSKEISSGRSDISLKKHKAQ